MNKKLIFILLGVVILVVAAVLIYVLVLSPGGEPEPVYTYYSAGDAFIINVQDGRYIFKTTIFLVVDTDDAKLTEQLEAQKPLLRDILNYELRQRTGEQLEKTEYLDTLRTELAQALNEGLTFDGFENPVYSMLFTEYFLQ